MGRKKIILAISLMVIILICGIGFSEYYTSLNQISGSSKYAIFEELTKLHGENYSEKMIATQTINQKEVFIKENMNFFIEKKTISPWNDTMPDRDSKGILFSKAYWMTVYKCGVEYVRYIVIDNDMISEAKRYKYVTYLAYEDNDLNSEARIFLDTSSSKCTYSDSKAEYEDINKMFLNARSYITDN